MPQVLITGANRGIGQALAQHYRQAGWQVIATARRPMGDQVALDVTDAASLAALAARIAPPLDLLICNAGVLLDGGQSLQRGYDAALWAASFAVNVTGAFHTVQALLPQLQAARGAKIGLISSTMGSTARAPGGHYMYRASKAALVNLGRNLAADLARDGISLGIYHPGWVQTDMGGRGAEITPAQSAAGLQARLAQLSLQSSGCFESYDGTPLPY